MTSETRHPFNWRSARNWSLVGGAIASLLIVIESIRNHRGFSEFSNRPFVLGMPVFFVAVSVVCFVLFLVYWLLWRSWKRLRPTAATKLNSAKDWLETDPSKQEKP